MLNVNEYFDGQVKSIGFQGQDKPASVGVMAVGEYRFSTAAPELMVVVSGELQVQLPGESGWQSFKAGEQFNVAADSAFDVKVPVETAYLCVYG
ncbi:pyrimidine/purine nucleoside phosphorylase [Aliagarivorans marinus]|uniref:pyrimidine/purine nucleoside phosphorylase n=1 Tax=Aliagarivorans marinus TaxID=561965 RepID=UPI00040B8595|nr:pyrimidine/purine nucleoside phosphorylase [Aliagarivorans marinus]